MSPSAPPEHEPAAASASPDASLAVDDAADRDVPLVVDLDGTLVRTDVLYESIFAMLGRRPWLALLLPWWLRRGRAHLKRRVASYAVPDAETLPYHAAMLARVRAAKDAGRRVVLATATDARLAEPVRDRLGLFDGFIASDGGVNKRGAAKIEAIHAALGDRPFDYAGDSDADVPLVAAARRVILVNPTPALRAAAASAGNAEAVFDDRPPVWPGVIDLLRPAQWVKNTLVVLPLLLSHELGDAWRWVAAACAFVAFSLAASAVYVLNDLTDIASDRRHPRKRLRPLAAGTVRVPTAVTAGGVCLGASLAVAGGLVSWPFMAALLGYVAFTTAYTAVLKRKLFIDVLTLAWLYVYRILAGGVAVGVAISPWLGAFSLFVFLSLALVKRYAELRETVDKNGDAGATRAAVNPRRGYVPSDLDLLRVSGVASLYTAVMVFALYVNSEQVRALYERPSALWGVCPIVLYVMTRMWFTAGRGQMCDDPLVFLARDRATLAALGLAAAVVVFAAG